MGNLNLTHLVEHEIELEAEINIEEVQNAGNSFQNNKLPATMASQKNSTKPSLT